jgi:hypothetical protein
MHFTFKHGALFVLGVAVSLLIINQVGPVRDIVNKSYFGT